MIPINREKTETEKLLDEFSLKAKDKFTIEELRDFTDRVDSEITILLARRNLAEAIIKQLQPDPYISRASS